MKASAIWITNLNGEVIEAIKWCAINKYEENHRPGSGNDVAVVLFPSEKLDFQSRATIWPNANRTSIGNQLGDISVIGYPGEKTKGELWGMEGKGKLDDRGNILYDIST